MKRITIVMSLVLSVFVLSGCNGTGDDNNADKKACDKKGADWVWDVTKKECVAKATTKEECDEKGAGWVWDETNKKCNQVTAGLSDKEKCEAKGAGWVWNEDKHTDTGAEYTKCTKDLSMDCTDPAKPMVKTLVKDDRVLYIQSLGECEAPYYTVINSTGRNINGFKPWPVLSDTDCDSMGKEEFDYFFSNFQLTAADTRDATAPFTFTICNVKDKNFPCPSEGGVYEVQAGRTGFVITKVDKTVEELREMGCFRYLIEAEGPL